MIDQPVKVIVEYAHGTTPEWVKTLITAGAGAAVGFFSSSGLEFVKLWVSSRSTKKFATREILDEVRANRKILVPAIRGYQKSLPLTQNNGDFVLASLRSAVCQLSSDKYDFFYKEERPSLYKIDRERSLFTFYRHVGALRKLEKKALSIEEFERVAIDLNSGIMRADLYAMKFLKEHGIETSDAPWEIADEIYVWPTNESESEAL